MQRKVGFVEGEYYHIYNRGVDKRTIFNSDYDYKRFLLLLHILNNDVSFKVRDLLRSHSYSELMTEKNKKPLVAIGAYCLMPNHFHLLLTPLVKDGISKFMLKLQTSYAMYFNVKNERSGSLFQGPFKSQYIDNDSYMLYIYSYIHLNPAKLKDKNWKENGTKDFQGLKDFVFTYKYSSISEYTSRNEVVIDSTKFPAYRHAYKNDKEYFKNMIDNFLNYTDYTG